MWQSKAQAFYFHRTDVNYVTELNAIAARILKTENIS